MSIGDCEYAYFFEVPKILSFITWRLYLELLFLGCKVFSVRFIFFRILFCQITQYSGHPQKVFASFLVCFRSLKYRLSRHCSIVSVSRLCNLLITSSTVIYCVPNSSFYCLGNPIPSAGKCLPSSLFKVNAIMTYFSLSFVYNSSFPLSWDFFITVSSVHT